MEATHWLYMIEALWRNAQGNRRNISDDDLLAVERMGCPLKGSEASNFNLIGIECRVHKFELYRRIQEELLVQLPRHAQMDDIDFQYRKQRSLHLVTFC